MPHLLGLPAELLHMIIHELVAEDPHKAWRIRGVCHTSSKCIEDDILTNQPRAMLKNSQPQKSDCGVTVQHNMVQYLQYRVRKPLDINPDLPNAIAKMTDYICTTLPLSEIRSGTRCGTLSAKVLCPSLGRAESVRCCGRINNH
jgi:hypothetical protein